MPTQDQRPDAQTGIARLKAMGRLEAFQAMRERLAQHTTDSLHDNDDGENPELELVAQRSFANRKPTTIKEDVHWVADNLMLKVRKRHCPSASAWAMLQWARKNTNAFYTRFCFRYLK